MTYNGSAGSDKNAEFVQLPEAEFRDLAFDLLSKAEAFLEDVRKAGKLVGTKSGSICRKAHYLYGSRRTAATA